MPPRRPARRLDLPRPAVDPISIDPAIAEAIRYRHGARGWWQVLRILREPSCRQHAAAAELAVRTLAERDALVPGALFRALFHEARGGDPLIERAVEAQRTRGAEQHAIERNPDLAEEYSHWTELTGSPPRARPPPGPRTAWGWARAQLAELAADKARREERDREAADRAALEALADRLEALERGPP